MACASWQVSAISQLSSVNSDSPSTITCALGRLTTIVLGDRITVSGTLEPMRIGANVSLTYTRPDGTTVLRRSVTSRSGTYLDVYTPDTPGSWKVSASWTGDADLAPATSSPASFTVLDLPPGTSRITCFVDSSSTVVETPVKIFGFLFPTRSAIVSIQFTSDDGATWAVLTEQTTQSDGSYEVVWTWKSPGQYLLRATWSGDESRKPATSDPAAVSVAASRVTPAGITRATTWTYMVYLAADNNLGSNPGGSFYDVLNLNWMKSVGSTSSVNIIVLWDTAPIPTTPTQILRITYHSWTVEVNYGANLDTGDPATLTNFITWTTTHYPAGHYVLDLWNHGGGFKGVSWDYTSGNNLDMAELKTALANAGVKFDIVGFDACLMAMTEVAYQIRNWADYVVASEETIPGNGWPYNTFLADLTSTPSMSSSTLASAIVTRYRNYYLSTCSACTLSAVSTVQTYSLARAVKAFGSALRNGLATYGTQIATAYLNAEYYSDYTFIDLYDFARRVTEDITILDPSIISAADSVKTAVTSTVTSEWHGSAHPNSHGVTIYGEYYAPQYWTSYDGLDSSLATVWNNFVRVYLGLPLVSPSYVLYVQSLPITGISIMLFDPPTTSNNTNFSTSSPSPFTSAFLTAPSSVTIGSIYLFDHWELDGVNIGSNSLGTVEVGSGGQLNRRTALAIYVRAPVVGVTVTSSPGTGSGYVTVDGSPIVTPHTFEWDVTSEHAITATSIVPCGSYCQHVFLSWSDAGAQTHNIVVPSSPTTYTANYKTQYQLWISVYPSGGGSTNPAADSGYWYDSGAPASVSATAASGYSFYYWKLDDTNDGTNPSNSITMNSAHILTAMFRSTSSISVSMSVAPDGFAWIVSGTITPTQSSPGILTGTPVALSYSSDSGGTWSNFITVLTSSAGDYSVYWQQPYQYADFRVRASWNGNAAYEGSTSSFQMVSGTYGPFYPPVSVLVSGSGSVARGGSATFDVIVTSPSSYTFDRTLYIIVVGPDGYQYIDTVRAAVNAGETKRCQFVWQAPSSLTTGTYQVNAGLIPPNPAALGQTQIVVT